MTAASYQVMPPLAPEELEALRADIGERGILVPVLVDQHGRVLDGHHRRQIAAELGIECPTEIRIVENDDEARGIALTLNLIRRHLTREQRRELIASEIGARPDDSDRAIAGRFRCSPSTVGAVRRQVSNLDTTEESADPTEELVVMENSITAAMESLHENIRGHLRDGAPAGVLLAELTRFQYEGVPDPALRSVVAGLFAPLLDDLRRLAWAAPTEAPE